MTGNQRLHWRPSPLALALATSSAIALVLALLLRRAELVAFAAPLLGALVGVRATGLATGVVVRAERDTERCFAGETVRVRITAEAEGGCDEVSARVVAPAGLTAMNASFDALGATNEAFIACHHWGRFPVPVEVTLRAAGGLLIATAIAHPVELRVYPRPAPLRVAARPDQLPDRLGVHIGRARGEGVEFFGIRPYVPGDLVGAVNWPVSVRLGRLHVTERLAERAADVVALVDTYAVAGPAIDLAVRGAAEIVQAALRRGDRAGVLALGGETRWLGPDIGRRQFYRIVDAVLDATAADPGGRSGTGRVPRAALPAGACVIAFTPLLDARIGLALQEIRGRGHAILVVDVLRDSPVDAGEDPLVERLWRLERRGLHRDLASLGIPVTPWAAESTLDEALFPLARRPIPAGRPR